MLIAARGPFRVLVLLTRARYLPDYDTCMLHYVVEYRLGCRLADATDR